MDDATPRPGGFWIRLVAFGVDLVVIMLAQFMLGVLAASAEGSFVLQQLWRAGRPWMAVTDLNIDAITAWLTADTRARAGSLNDLAKIVVTQKGEPRKPSAGLLRAAPDYEQAAARLADCCRRLIRMRALAASASDLPPAPAHRSRIRIPSAGRQASAINWLPSS